MRYTQNLGGSCFLVRELGERFLVRNLYERILGGGGRERKWALK